METTFTLNEAGSQSWYGKLMNHINAFCEHWQLESEEREELRAFITDVAKAQFLAGNKSGIRWLKVQQAKEGVKVPQAA